ncbi:hypothetical protein MMC14_002718 [Varicellaria rhodocarpa]|nr:hypothetical protein [Varicellaria rhodocarpa]
MREVSDLQLVLEEVNDVVRAQGGREDRISPHLAALLHKARTTLLRLDKVIHYRLVKTQVAGCGKVKVAPLVWMREKSNVKQLQEELRDIRLNITMSLVTGTA